MPEDKLPDSDNESTPVKTSAQVEETRQELSEAEESVETLQGRLKELQERLTREGRSKAQITAKTEDLTGKLEQALSEREELSKQIQDWEAWYIRNHATTKEREAYERKQQGTQGSAVAAQREKMLLEIAKEENSKLKKVLVSAYEKGDILSPSAIASFREAFGEKEESKEVPEKEPTKVTSVRSTGSKEANLQEQYQLATKAKNTSEMIRLKSAIERAKQGATTR